MRQNIVEKLERLGELALADALFGAVHTAGQETIGRRVNAGAGLGCFFLGRCGNSPASASLKLNLDLPNRRRDVGAPNPSQGHQNRGQPPGQTSHARSLEPSQTVGGKRVPHRRGDASRSTLASAPVWGGYSASSP